MRQVLPVFILILFCASEVAEAGLFRRGGGIFRGGGFFRPLFSRGCQGGGCGQRMRGGCMGGSCGPRMSCRGGGCGGGGCGGGGCGSGGGCRGGSCGPQFQDFNPGGFNDQFDNQRFAPDSFNGGSGFDAAPAFADPSTGAAPSTAGAGVQPVAGRTQGVQDSSSPFNSMDQIATQAASRNFFPIKNTSTVRTVAVDGVPVPEGAIGYRFKNGGIEWVFGDPRQQQAPPPAFEFNGQQYAEAPPSDGGTHAEGAGGGTRRPIASPSQPSHATDGENDAALAAQQGLLQAIANGSQPQQAPQRQPAAQSPTGDQSALPTGIAPGSQGPAVSQGGQQPAQQPQREQQSPQQEQPTQKPDIRMVIVSDPPNCGPCRTYEPTANALKQQFPNQVVIVHPSQASKYVRNFGGRIPFTMVYDQTSKKVLLSETGVQSGQTLANLLSGQGQQRQQQRFTRRR